MKFFGYLLLTFFVINTALISADYVIYDDATLPDYILNEPAPVFENKMSFYEMDYIQKARDYSLSSALVKRNYDVISYDLFMDWYDPLSYENESATITPEQRIWTGKNTIKIEIIEDGVEEITFDAEHLKILGVSIDGESVNSLEYPLDSKSNFSIPLGTTKNTGDELEIVVDYKYDYHKNNGFFIYEKGEQDNPWYRSPVYYDEDSVEHCDTSIVEERLAYTMSEPQSARAWMPCNDASYDKAYSAISVRVPNGYTVSSNGILEDLDEGPEATIFHWKSSYQMATYLMVANASIFATYTEWYPKVTNPEDSIPIQYYVWQKDYDNELTDGIHHNARYALREHVRMMNLYSKKFIEYPYEKYGITAVSPYSFGGMEHQTLTTLHRQFLRSKNSDGGDNDWRSRNVMAHELAHQWLGDLITCATWNDIWINEGGATWSEGLYSEDVYEGGYIDNMMTERSSYIWRYAKRPLPRIYGLPVNTIFGNYAVLVYQKASWVYHMLREMLGEESYWSTLRNMLETYKFQSIETEQFKDFFKQENPEPMVDFDTFFEQWIHSPGHPIYDLSSSVIIYHGVQSDVKVNVRQVQSMRVDSVPEVFITPLTLTFYNSATEEIYKERFLNDKQDQMVEVSLDFVPDMITVDLTKTLCEVDTTSIVTGVEEDRLNELSFNMNIYPNPVKDRLQVEFSHDGRNRNASFEIFSMLGELVYTKTWELGSAGTELRSVYLPANIGSGSYRAVLRSSGAQASNMLIINK